MSIVTATQFASTTSGYVTGILVPMIGTALLTYWFATRSSRTSAKTAAEARLRKMEDAVLKLTLLVNEIRHPGSLDNDG